MNQENKTTVKRNGLVFVGEKHIGRVERYEGPMKVAAGPRHWARARTMVRRALAAGAVDAHASIVTRRGRLVGVVSGCAGDPEMGWTWPWYLDIGQQIGPRPQGSFSVDEGRQAR